MLPRTTIILHHFDKCGGTTLQEYLKNYFDADKIVNIHTLVDDNPRYMAKALSFASKKKILDSHFIHDPFGVTFTLEDTKIHRITFLREPLARLISHWHMICRWQDHEISHSPKEFKQIRQIAKTSFKDFVLAIKNGFPLVRHLKNFYANHLLYTDIPTRESYYTHSLITADLNVSKPICDAALGKFNFIGLVEDYETSLLKLNNYLHLPPALNLQKLNAHDSQAHLSKLDEETLSLAEEILLLDKYIYHKAVKIYNTYKENFLKLLPNKEGDIKAICQENYEHHLLRTHPTKQTKIFVSMAQALKGSGWHARERNGKKVSRWTGPGVTAYLDLVLNRTEPLVFTLHISNYLSVQQIKNLKIFIDNKPVEYQKIRLGISHLFLAKYRKHPANKLLVKGRLETNLHSQFTRFTIDTGIVLKSPNKEDPRLLGVEIISLTVKPKVNWCLWLVKLLFYPINYSLKKLTQNLRLHHKRSCK